MQQASVTDYFKVKKRGREEISTKGVKGKLLGITKVKEEPKDVKPIPISSKSTPESSPEHSSFETQPPAPLIPTTPTAGPSRPTKTSVLPTPQSPQLQRLKGSLIEGRTPLPHSPIKSLRLIEAEIAKSPKKKTPILSSVVKEDIFSSPVKLNEIKSLRSPEPRAAVKRLFASPDVKSDGPTPSKLPAYKRFQHLLEKTPVFPVVSRIENGKGSVETPMDTTPPSPSTQTSLPIGMEDDDALLPLPVKFRLLEEMFHAVETVASILHNRKESITFLKIKPAVGELFRVMPLRERNLAEILRVFPNCYKLKREKTPVTAHSTGGYQLTIAFNFDTMEQSQAALPPTVMSLRRKTFRNNLRKFCHKHHLEFLKTLKPAIVIPEGRKVTRWHPKFNVDSIPDIKPAEIPRMPHFEEYVSARDMMRAAQNIIENANPRMKKAIQDMLKKPQGNESQAKKDETEKPNATETKVKSESLRGVQQSLIEKIRAREAEKSIAALTLTPDQRRKKTMLSRLPKLVDIIRNVTVVEKKAAISFDLAVERIHHSLLSSLTHTEIEEHIKMLVTMVPSWIRLLKLSERNYLKVDKEANIDEIIKYLNDELRKMT